MLKSLILSGCLLVPIWVHGEVRTWTSSDGREVEMELVKADEGAATFSLNGNEMTLPLDKLSPEDQEFIKEWLANAPEPPVGPIEWPEAVEVRAPDLNLEELETEEGDFLKVYNTDHFSFFAEANLGIATMRDVGRTFEATHALLTQLPLGIDPTPPAGGRFIGELYQSRKSYVAAGGPSHSGGVYMPSKGKLMIPFESIGLKKVGSSFRIDDDYDVNTIIHEITHQLMDSWLNFIPAWAVEGSAEYTSSMPFHAGRFRVAAMKSGVKDYIQDDMRGKTSSAPPLVSIPKLYSMDYGEFSKAHGGDSGKMRDYYYSSFMVFYYFLHLRGDGDGAEMLAYFREVKKLKDEWVAYRAEMDAFLEKPEVKTQADGRFSYPSGMSPPKPPAIIDENGVDGAMVELLNQHLYGEEPGAIAEDLVEKFKEIGVRF